MYLGKIARKRRDRRTYFTGIVWGGGGGQRLIRGTKKKDRCKTTVIKGRD